MSCILRVSGNNLKPTKVLRGSPLIVDHAWKKGEPRRIGGSGSHQVEERGGFTIVVSDADGACVSQQVDDALTFLSENAAQLEQVLGHDSVEARVLDFACCFLVDGSGPAARFCHFPAELMALCSKLQLALEVSVYATEEEPSAV